MGAAQLHYTRNRQQLQGDYSPEIRVLQVPCTLSRDDPTLPLGSNGRKATMMRFVLVAASLVAVAASSATADDLQVSKFRYARSTLAAIFVCPGTLAPSDCNARSALDSIVDPPWAQEAGCGVGGQAVLAGSGLRLAEGQYVKVVCVRDAAQVN
jgi:hypothetical protein